MLLFLLIGLIGVVIVLLFLRKPLANVIGEDHRLVLKLRERKWFQSHWLAGIFLFVINTIFFFLTFLVLVGLIYFFIPFLHLVVMVAAVVISIISWLIINKAWIGAGKNRLKMATMGSSFYVVLTVAFLYLYVTLEPNYPGEDLFMRAMGLSLAIFVTLVAAVTCFVMTGFAPRTKGGQA